MEEKKKGRMLQALPFLFWEWVNITQSVFGHETDLRTPRSCSIVCRLSETVLQNSYGMSRDFEDSIGIRAKTILFDVKLHAIYSSNG